MTRHVHVLHVDDDAGFGSLTGSFLEREGFTVKQVRNAAEAREYLADNGSSLDCVVSDYDMPGGTGLDILEHVRNEQPDLPFILFTGKGSEEIAADAISRGVTDYLQKGGVSDTFAMLANRIENAVESRRARSDAERNERLLEKIVEHATDVIATVDSAGHVVFISGSVETVLGYTPDEVREMNPFDIIHPDDRERVEEQFESRVRDPDSPARFRHRAVHKDGSTVYLEARAYNLVSDPDVEAILIYSRPDSTTDDG